MNRVNSSLQIGITVFDKVFHHAKLVVELSKVEVGGVTHTVDSNGDSLGQDIAISALKRRHLMLRVELGVLCWDVSPIELNDLEIELVGLRYCLDSS